MLSDPPILVELYQEVIQEAESGNVPQSVVFLPHHTELELKNKDYKIKNNLMQFLVPVTRVFLQISFTYNYITYHCPCSNLASFYGQISMNIGTMDLPKDF